MSYGIRIWGANGALELDETSFSVRVVYSDIVQSGVPGPGRSRTIAIAGVSPSTHSAVCIPIGAYPQDPNAQNLYAIQYEPQIYEGGVIVWFGNRATPSGTVGLGPQRLLVMRYR